MCLILLAGVTLTACDDGEELSTDQYGNEIKLNSFGPCPVLRGVDPVHLECPVGQ